MIGRLLTHPNVFVRILTAWLVGVAILAVVWTASYWLFPEGLLRGWTQLVTGGPVDRSAGVTVLALKIAVRNFITGIGVTVLAGLFAVGWFPLGYLAPWLWFALYGMLLGTNSFSLESAGGRFAPSISVLWTRSGTREMTAYIVVAAAMATHHLWKQQSWINWSTRRVSTGRGLRFSTVEGLSFVAALVFLVWSAYIEAWQIFQDL